MLESNFKNYIHYNMDVRNYKSCLEGFSLYDEKNNLWEDWDFRIRMSKLYEYGYCPNINSVYREINNGPHNSDLKVHYSQQIKIYNKNKFLIEDLQREEISLIHNRVYSKIKSLFLHIMEKNRQDKLLFRLLFYAVHFILIFKTRKSISAALRTLLNK